ncbi:MAG: putative N-acetylmannosamine-6-phosphate 2-epimerase [Melioribacteraceae bacterium]|nr:MAG: putative N-acetylmannosamine-6-phosphate 2-epimerase [Melioribacteraceae bacterium]
MKNKIFKEMRGGLVVSCQAEGDSPFNTPEGVSLFAKAAVQGGAVAIRSQGLRKTKKIIETVDVPVIGLIKDAFSDGSVKITGSYNDVEKLAEIGTHIIAVDGTYRKREGLSGPDFINSIKAKYDVVIMADIATPEQAFACAEAGADCISTTLSGYTPETADSKTDRPDYNLVKQIIPKLNCPVFAEGRVNTPEFAAEMIRLGVWGVVVGTAITRPHIVTDWFVKAIESAKNEKYQKYQK